MSNYYSRLPFAQIFGPSTLKYVPPKSPVELHIARSLRDLDTPKATPDRARQ